MPLNCNSFRFALRCQPIYLAFATFTFSLLHTLSIALCLSLSPPLFIAFPDVCYVECACVLCNLLVLCPLICVVYLTQMPHKNNKQNNNSRQSFMHMQSPHTHSQTHSCTLHKCTRSSACRSCLVHKSSAEMYATHLYVRAVLHTPTTRAQRTETMPGTAGREVAVWGVR